MNGISILSLTRQLVVGFMLMALTVFAFASGIEEGSSLADVDVHEFRQYSEIENTTQVNLHIQISEGWDMRIEGDESALERIFINQIGNELKIYRQRGRLDSGWYGPVEMYISVPTLSGLRVYGSGSAEVSGVIRGGELNLSSTGSGTIRAQARVGELAVRSSGSGSISGRFIAEQAELRLTGSGSLRAALVSRSADFAATGSGTFDIEGQSDFTQIRLTGAGSFNGSGFTTKHAEVALTGAGTAILDISDTVIARLSGVGSLRYSGGGLLKDSSITGVGSIVQLDELSGN